MTWLEDKIKITDALQMMPESTVDHIVSKIELLWRILENDKKLILELQEELKFYK